MPDEMNNRQIMRALASSLRPSITITSAFADSVRAVVSAGALRRSCGSRATAGNTASGRTPALSSLLTTSSDAI